MQFAKAAPAAKELRRQAGAWLKELRARAGLSQLQLAERLNLKYYTFVSQVENGFGRVPTESMEAWARALGADPPTFARHALLLRSGAPSTAVRGEGMTVIAFFLSRRATCRARRRMAGGRAREPIVQSLTPAARQRTFGGWDVGVTEIGDPQFYLLGPPPHEECILCISRLGRVYVLEDGAGQGPVRAQQPGRAGRAGDVAPAEEEVADRRPHRAHLVRAARGLRGEARGRSSARARSCSHTSCRSSPHLHDWRRLQSRNFPARAVSPIWHGLAKARRCGRER